MDLFDNEFKDVSQLPADNTRKRNKSTPINCLKMRFALYKEFTTALQHRDKRLLNFLLSDKQESKHWTTKQDFIDKYLNACKTFELYQSITITVHQGIGGIANSGWQSVVAVVIESTKEKERLWRFDLLLNLDEFSKLKITKAKVIYSSSAFKGQPSNEFFKELPHPSCNPPEPEFSFKYTARPHKCAPILFSLFVR
jgi:hypothetical protein